MHHYAYNVVFLPFEASVVWSGLHWRNENKLPSTPTRSPAFKLFDSHLDIVGVVGRPSFMSVQFSSSCCCAWTWYRPSVQSNASFCVTTAVPADPSKPLMKVRRSSTGLMYSLWWRSSVGMMYALTEPPLFGNWRINARKSLRIFVVFFIFL